MAEFESRNLHPYRLASAAGLVLPLLYAETIPWAWVNLGVLVAAPLLIMVRVRPVRT